MSTRWTFCELLLIQFLPFIWVSLHWTDEMQCRVQVLHRNLRKKKPFLRWGSPRLSLGGFGTFLNLILFFLNIFRLKQSTLVFLTTESLISDYDRKQPYNESNYSFSFKTLFFLQMHFFGPEYKPILFFFKYLHFLLSQNGTILNQIIHLHIIYNMEILPLYICPTTELKKKPF